MKGKVDNFTNRLKYAMEEQSITQQKLADLTSMNKSHINRYLNGRVNPKLNKIDLFARILNVSPTWLMGYDVPIKEKDTISSFENKLSNTSYLEFVNMISNFDLNDDDLKLIYNFILNLKKQ